MQERGDLEWNAKRKSQTHHDHLIITCGQWACPTGSSKNSIMMLCTQQVIDQEKLCQSQRMTMACFWIMIETEISNRSSSTSIQMIQDATLQCPRWLVRNRAIDLQILH